ncbi:MAG TPA: FmdB family zinc ribbon protein [Acidimicrobiales bacterium]|nr:FmdB family zinc ribbon protein [Acidimicrobiales bacterium]
MPTYEYACTACGHRLEAVQSFTDDPLTECPECGAALRKVYGAVGIVLKGSGFYKNDSRAASSGNGSGKKGADGQSSDSSAGDSSSKDSAPKKESGSDKPSSDKSSSDKPGSDKSEKSTSSKDSTPASSTAS